MGLNPAAATQLADKWGRAIAQPTDEQSAATQHVLSLMKPSPLMPHQKFLQLDLSDETQHQFFMDRFGHLGGHPLGDFFPSRAELVDHMVRTAKTGPAKPPTMLNAMAATSVTYQPVALISMFDYDTANTNQVTAGGLVSVPNGATLIDSVIEIYQGSTLLGKGTGSGYGAYTVAADASGTQTVEATADAPLTAVLSGHYSTTQNATAVPFAVSQTLSPVPPLSITVTNPVHKVTTSPNPITVALGRAVNPPGDTDYSYNVTPVPPYNFDLEITVTGSAVPNKPTDQFNPAQTVTGSLVLIKQNGSKSGGGVVVTYPGTLASSCTVIPSMVTWTLNPADFKQTPPPWSSGDTILLNLNLVVAMNGTIPVTITVTSDQSGNLVGQQPQNTSFIDALAFYWGCLAAETMVTLADGTEQAIRHMAKGDCVETGNGTVLTVRSIKTGRESKPMIEIATESGKRILVTDGHPILTETGMKTARSIAQGERIIEKDGAGVVCAINQVSYDGIVYNLVLEDANGCLPDHAAFLADGIVVGDDSMQTLVERADVSLVEQAIAQQLTASLKGWELDIENHRRVLAGEPLLTGFVNQ